MCPKLIELLSWNGPTVHVWCFMSPRASTKTFVSRVKKTAKKIFISRKIRQQGHSLAEVSLYLLLCVAENYERIRGGQPDHSFEAGTSGRQPTATFGRKKKAIQFHIKSRMLAGMQFCYGGNWQLGVSGIPKFATPLATSISQFEASRESSTH